MLSNLPPGTSDFDIEEAAGADDLRGVVSSSGDVNGPVWAVKASADDGYPELFTDPHELAAYLRRWEWTHVNSDPNGSPDADIPASVWLEVYDSLKPWLKEAR